MRDATILTATRPARAGNGARRQERSVATRRTLVAAARRIFARDGFELARLEDIAAAAGKTRGAFYAHFQDKEDVFFAIFEEDLARDQDAIRQSLAAVSSPQERIEALSRHLLAILQDKRRLLLGLEFKLYAIRRPQRQKRLADLHAAMCMRCAETHIAHLLPELGRANSRRKRKQAAIVGAVLDGLTLNRLFDPPALDHRQMLSLITAALEIAIHQPRSR